MNMKAYQDRFIEKLNALSAEELTRIFKEVLDIKENDILKTSTDILAKSVSNDYKIVDDKNVYFNNFIKFLTSSKMTVKQTKMPDEISYKLSHYKVPKNIQGMLKKAS
ncbi:Uncharacterised protein [Veillonella parvula]|uniref:Uncharacterized protein n=1 Tax=Veillonella parvula TaxID=29466 RepID=A0A6N3A4R3_VEIPA